MGDRYQPSYRRRRDPPSYDDYAPESSYRETRSSDRYTSRDAADHRPHRSERPSRSHGGYSNDTEDRYQPQGEFTFRAQGPTAPRFPSPPRHRERSSRYTQTASRDRQSRDRPGGDRGGFNPRGRRGFRPRAAHTRDILSRSGRERTPEQLDGMNVAGGTRFRDIDYSSEDERASDAVDPTQNSAGESTDGRSRKRIKTAESAADTQPKWSNPDPYTVLPPPETLGAPKKDIVQVIRKAKVDMDSKTDSMNAVKENVDFISFNVDEDNPSDTTIDIEGNAVPVEPSASFLPRERSQLERGVRSPSYDMVMPSDDELTRQYDGRRRNKKRKREYLIEETPSDLLEEWWPNGTDSTPWCTVDRSETSNVGIRLHEEISDFYDFVKPYDYEEAVRRDLITRIQRAVRTGSLPVSESVGIHCFGSFAAGLYLPTADMDLVAASPEFLQTGRKIFCQNSRYMFNLKSHLERCGVAPKNGVAVVSRAKVPIIKFSDKLSGIKVDISFENNSGLLANQTFQIWKAQFPAMPVLVVLIKQMMAMRGLNEVFSGGIGGFTIICLVTSMMQLMPELQSGSMDTQRHYGDLLLNFLDLYGNRFDVQKTGIQMNPPCYYDKIRNPLPKQNPYRLTIIDPNRPDNDISGGSSNIEKVFAVFRTAYTQIQRRLTQVHYGEDVQSSLLGCVWGGNYASFTRQREKLNMLHRGYAVSPPPPPPPSRRERDRARKRAQQVSPPISPSPPSPPGQRRAPDSSRRSLKHALPPRPSGESQPSARRGVVENGVEIAGMSRKQRLAHRRSKKSDLWKARHPDIMGSQAQLAYEEMMNSTDRRHLSDPQQVPKQKAKKQKNK